MRWKLFVAAAAVTTFMLAGYTGAAGAATGTRNVTAELLRDGPPDTERPNLWFRWDTRTGGGVNLTTDFGDPAGDGNDGAGPHHQPPRRRPRPSCTTRR